MSDYSELRRLAVAAISPDSLEPIVIFRHYATPAVILVLIAENEALRKVANELRRFATCEAVHHDQPDWHKYDEPCKVLARIDSILSHGDKTGD